MRRLHVTRKVIQLLGYALATGQFAILYAVFLTAYKHPTKAVLVVIDKFNEANVEFIFIPFAFALSVLGLYYLIKEF